MLTFFLILIFLRPFISSLAFPYLNLFYSALLLFSIIFWFLSKGASLDKLKPLAYPLILFLLSIFISVVFSSNKIIGFRELYKYISGLLLLLIVANLSYEDKTRVIRTLILSGFIISLLAIYQAIFGFRHLLAHIAREKISDPFVLNYIDRGRVFLPFVSPNMLAGYLIMLVPLTLNSKKWIPLATPFFVALILTKSVGALLSLCLILGIYFSFQERFKKRNIVILLLILGITAMVFITRSVAQNEYYKPVFSTLMRLDYWRETLKIIKGTPLTGIGIGNFNLAYSRYAHNSYLQIWAEMGILGIISIFWLLISIFKSAIKNIDASGNRKLMASLIAANAAFLIHNLIDFTFFLPEVSLIWWVILGLII